MTHRKRAGEVSQVETWKVGRPDLAAFAIAVLEHPVTVGAGRPDAQVVGTVRGSVAGPRGSLGVKPEGEVQAEAEGVQGSPARNGHHQGDVVAVREEGGATVAAAIVVSAHHVAAEVAKLGLAGVAVVEGCHVWVGGLAPDCG